MKYFKYLLPRKNFGFGKMEIVGYQSPTQVDLTLDSHSFQAI